MKSTEDTIKQDNKCSDESKNTTAQCAFSPREPSEMRYFTFDTLEDQLGPLQTPGYGHLLHTEQKAERVGIWKTRADKLNITPPQVSLCLWEGRAIYRKVKWKEPVWREPDKAAQASSCWGLLLLKQLTTNLLVSSTQKQVLQSSLWPNVGKVHSLQVLQSCKCKM